jgi:hypothetical protein
MTLPNPLEPDPDAEMADSPATFDPNQTSSYQLHMKRAPKWLSSILASNNRERNRLRQELGSVKGSIALLMKPRNGSRWTAQDRLELQQLLRAASAVYPYLLIWALPGSIVLLPFLAWHLDARRKDRQSKATA